MIIPTYQQVLDGDQTQLRIVVKPGEEYMLLAQQVFNTQSRRHKWMVGQTLAMQPSFGQKAIARIRVTGIRQEDVRQININDVRHEGFRSKYEFLETWTMMHDKAAYSVRPDGTWTDVPLAQQQKSWRDWLQGQGDEKYQAWVLEFELVREAVSA